MKEDKSVKGSLPNYRLCDSSDGRRRNCLHSIIAAFINGSICRGNVNVRNCDISSPERHDLGVDRALRKHNLRLGETHAEMG